MKIILTIILVIFPFFQICKSDELAGDVVIVSPGREYEISSTEISTATNAQSRYYSIRKKDDKTRIATFVLNKSNNIWNLEEIEFIQNTEHSLIMRTIKNDDEVHNTIAHLLIKKSNKLIALVIISKNNGVTFSNKLPDLK